MAHEPGSLPILIAGGGICGLTAAIALARQGHQVKILERSPEFSEAGAGIQLGPNAVRMLHEVEVHKYLEGRVVAAEKVDVRHGLSGESLISLPIGAWSQRKFNLPYWVVHRADLQAALLETVKTLPSIEIVNGCSVISVQQSEDSVCVIGSENARFDGAALIGADGIWSRVRSLLFDVKNPEYAGRTAWRSVVDVEQVPSEFRSRSVGLWLAPDTHLVHYPVNGGSGVNIVAVTAHKNYLKDWNTDGKKSELMIHFSRWCPAVRELLECADDWRRWSLFDVSSYPQWQSGRVVIAGDAAHPVLPFLAQGGALALEDGIELARCVELSGNDFASAWKLFEENRKVRTTKIQRESKRNGWLYHLKGAAGWSRDRVLRNTPPDLFLRRYKWIYGHDLH